MVPDCPGLGGHYTQTDTVSEPVRPPKRSSLVLPFGFPIAKRARILTNLGNSRHQIGADCRNTFYESELRIMSDQNKSDHWNSLASNLGATPPADDKVESADAGEPEVVEPEPQADIEEPIVERSRERTVPEEVPPTDWGKLVGDLGLEPPEQPSEPAFGQDDTSPPPASLDEPAIPPEEASDQVQLAVEPDDQDQVAEEEDNELVELALDARDGGGFASGVFDDPADIQSDDEDAEFIADDANADASLTDVDATDTAEPPAEKKSGRRRRRRRPRGRKSSDNQADMPPEPSAGNQPDDAVAIVDDETEDALETPLVADETESASPDGEEPPTKTKRRRRRRRGSGRKTTPASEDDQSAEKDSLESDDKSEVLSNDKPKRRSRRKTPRDAELEVDQETEESGKTSKSSHRAIPSWAEAIDVVISANLENHKKTSGGSRSRGGRKRGGRERSSGKAK